MKYLLFLGCMIVFYGTLFSQDTYVVDTVPAYLKTKKLPNFSIVTDIKKKDTTIFTQNNLPENTPVVIIYFSPECGHCEIEAKQIGLHMDSLRKAFFVFVSYHPLEKIKAFSEKYYLNKFSNIVVGRDIAYYIPVFFKVKYTPFVAVYDKNKNLIKVYEQGSEIKELIQLVQ
ncbi:MAG: TlpA family protein disulfide reductase [Chitinophagaceae bacterium]